MSSQIFGDATIYASLISLMSIGLTLIFITTKVSNFAHGSTASIGIYVSLTATRIWETSAYYGLPIAFALGGLASLALYVVVIRPLMRKDASSVSLLAATLAYDLLLVAGLNIYADYLTRVYKVSSRAFILRGTDFTILGQPGILFVSTGLTLSIIVILYLVLTRTKFGTAMRAVVENPQLASVMGVNTNLRLSTSWFLAGGLASAAGVLLPLWFMCGPQTGSSILLSIFAASVVGGLSSIFGSALGGYLVGMTEILATNYLAQSVGAWIISYRPAIPLLAIVVTLLIAPTGLAGIDLGRILRLRVSKKRVGGGMMSAGSAA
ncbi:branched-chain amino acid ABC transporter permease [Candidatus Bathyarchaeota archaeon]|nr:branched-chain amino acid ABC transporter permease [Candidatus Bathyarchaeota archaeon]